MSYDLNYLQDCLEQYGEIIITLESGREFELHLHDANFIDDPSEVIVDAADGGFAFTPDRVESLAFHEQTLAEIGHE